MEKTEILGRLGKREVKAEDVAEFVAKDPGLLPELLSGVSSEVPRTKFNAAKILRIISRKNPGILYSRMDFFIRLLDSQNNILKWVAMDVIGNLASIDSENKFDRIFEKYFGFLSADSMITIGHVVDNSGKIAKAKPHLSEKITRQLLKLENIQVTEHITQECKNILLGKAIPAFDVYFDQIEDKTGVIHFVKKQLKNTRSATKTKAAKFLKKRS